MKFTQELVDFLNHGVMEPSHERLDEHPSLLNFITCPRVIIRPALFADAQRVSVTDNHRGRFITILKRSGERSYIFQIQNEALTVEEVEALIHKIEDKGGSCRIEQTFLVIDLPLGYLLDMDDVTLLSVLRSLIPS